MAERQVVTVARRLLAVIEQNWPESWLQSMLRNGGEPISKDLIPEVIEEMALLVKRAPSKSL